MDASIDEADVSRIRTGQRATFTVDAFPGQTFEGEVRQVRKAAQNVANVVTYVAVVGFTNTAGRLLPGMTANVRVVTESRENVLKIPNSALRVRIAGVEPAATGASAPVSPVAPSSAPKTGRSGFSFLSEAVAQPSGGGGGGGLAAQRERLVNELQLTADQQSKLDAIYSDMRPKFMAMREMDDAERMSAREKITTEMRSKISAMLTVEQRNKYQEMIANAPPAGGGNRPAVSSSATPNTPNSVATRADSMPATSQKPSQNTASGAVGGGVAASAPTTSTASPSVPSAAQSSGAPAAGSGGSGGGPLGEFRNRLVSELQMGADQQQKLDALFTEARPKFAAMRDAAPEDRPKVRERIMSELRAKINDFLTPEQKTKYAALLAEIGSRSSSRGRIYLLNDQGKPVAYNVRLGITDGTSTELIIAPNTPSADVFKEGALVITGVSGGAAAPAARSGAPSGPRMPF